MGNMGVRIMVFIFPVWRSFELKQPFMSAKGCFFSIFILQYGPIKEHAGLYNLSSGGELNEVIRIFKDETIREGLPRRRRSYIINT